LTRDVETSGENRRVKRSLSRRGKPVEGEELKLLPDDRTVEAAYKILRIHFGRMRWNEPGTRSGEDPEYLHDMRVAARRLGAAVKIFEAALPKRGLQESTKDLNWIRRALGRARDLDVHLMNLQAVFKEVPSEQAGAIPAYTEKLRALREEARRSMLRTLDARRYAAFVERFQGWLDEGPPPTPDAPKALVPAAVEGREIILGELSRVLKKGRACGSAAADAELHRLRIRCKRLRYACEFFGDVYGPPAAKLAKRVTKIQDILGAHHDAVMERETLAEFAERIEPGARSASKMYLAVGQLTAVIARRAAQSRRKFAEAWKKFDRVETRAPLEARLKKVADRARAAG
jgi:CHAD domain-containing protein